MILESIRSGLNRVWSSKRMLIPFYLVNLFFGLMIMLPFAYALDDFVGNSLMRQQLGAAMDYDFLFEFMEYGSSGLASAKGMIPLVPAVYWLVALFLSGGAFAVFARAEKYTPAAFWGGAAAYFGRFLRLVLISLPVLAALFSLRYLVDLVQWIFYGDDPYEYIIYWGAWIKMAVGYLGLILYGLVFDYARIHLAVTGNRKVRHSLWQGARFAALNLRRTFSLAFLLFLFGWLFIYLYYTISNLFVGESWAALILIGIWQQLYIISKMVLRLTSFSSQISLYQRLTAV